MNMTISEATMALRFRRMVKNSFRRLPVPALMIRARP